MRFLYREAALDNTGQIDESQPTRVSRYEKRSDRQIIT